MSTKEKYMIGIDAGGTSTKGVAYSVDGLVISSSIEACGSPAVEKEKVIWHHIQNVIDDLINKIDSKKYTLDFIQMGLSAFSIIDNVEEMEELFTKKYHVAVSIKSDTLIALYSVLKNEFENGVVILSGTGVAVYGKSNEDFALIGGWGHIIRELGSGYSTVLHTALSIIDAMESDAPLNSFQKNFLSYLKLCKIKDLKHLFYGYSKPDIAKHASFIKILAKTDDFAYKLLYEEGKSLGAQAVKAVKKLKLDGNFVIGVRGGFIQNQNEALIEGITDVLKENKIENHLIVDDEEPIRGTYYMYKKIRGI